jgi:hypothetical protein
LAITRIFDLRDATIYKTFYLAPEAKYLAPEVHRRFGFALGQH